MPKPISQCKLIFGNYVQKIKKTYSLTIGKDGCIYGVAGKSCCHLFRYNPKDGELMDLGILYVSAPRSWHGYEFAAMVTGEKGEIYLGESDRISHLFVYFPTYIDECLNKEKDDDE